MRHLRRFNRVLGGFSRLGEPSFALGLAVFAGFSGIGTADAALQIAWEPPTSATPQVLKDYSPEELAKRKEATLTEADPLAKDEKAKFLGPSLSALVQDTTKSLSAADRATTDLVVLKTRTGKEALMPKAFLVKYPQIQLALKRNGQPLGPEAPRVVLPASTNAKIRKEGILLAPLFVSELSEITLTSYEKRFGRFILTRRTDPAAMRGEKLFLQNCVACHSQPGAVTSSLASAEKIEKVAGGSHPEIAGLRELKSLFDKKATRSLSSYLEAFKVQTTAKN